MTWLKGRATHGLVDHMEGHWPANEGLHPAEYHDHISFSKGHFGYFVHNELEGRYGVEVLRPDWQQVMGKTGWGWKKHFDVHFQLIVNE